jgi:prepilin-type N-terminal cleavage/methylation domain-containing protein
MISMKALRKLSDDLRGFTAIEIVMVMSIVGMLSMVGAYNVRRALDREQVDGWVRSIVYDITAGQQAAITRRTTVTAAFQKHTYTVAVLGGGVLRSDALPSQITFGNDLQTFSYDRRGIPSGAFSLTVLSTTTGRTYTITVESGTGRATFSEP